MPVQKLTPQQKVTRFIRRHRLILPGQKVIAAVSGGPDSVCLLHILAGLRKVLGFELHIAHLNHRLRGGESDADAAYVAALAKKTGIAATIGSRDVAAYRAREKLSLEEAAREVRYTFLAETAAGVGVARVAVGHTADDHIETVIMHLLRGSGTAGLRGLLPVSAPRPGLIVIRPLLGLTRQETTAYCRQHRLQPRLDLTNLSPGFFRNRIRLELVPELEKYNPRVREAILRTASIAADDVEFIEQETSRAAEDIVSAEAGAVILEKKKFLALPPALQRVLLRTAIGTVRGTLKDIEAGHIEDLLGALGKPAGKTIILPEGLKFTVEYSQYVISSGVFSGFLVPPEQEVALKVPGIIRNDNWEIEATVIRPAAYAPNDDKNMAVFDLAKTGKKLAVRRPLPGDVFQPLGMAAAKKLNRFMIDAKIPRNSRGDIPIITAGGRIIWVAGYRIDERVKVREETTQILSLEFRPFKR